MAWHLSPTLPIHLILLWVTFFFVSLDEKILKGKCFANVEEVKQTKMTEALKGIKIGEFENCFKQWKKHLDRCIASNREYFEGDWSLKL